MISTALIKPQVCGHYALVVIDSITTARLELEGEVTGPWPSEAESCHTPLLVCADCSVH